MKVNQIKNIIEITFSDGSCYMLIFNDQKSAEKTKNEINDRDNELDCHQYITNLNFKVMLNREDILMINQAAREVPPIYKIAKETGVDRVIIFT